MVKSSLGIKSFLVLVMVMVNVVTMVPSLPILSPQSENTQNDSSTRIERSAPDNFTGTTRRVRMFIRNKYLQIFPDGTVNATDDATSEYAIIQQSGVTKDTMKIQGIATCAFLCMDSCGLLYSTRDFDDECVFNETLEAHYYNTYWSVKHSNEKYRYYIGIMKSGTPRKIEIKTGANLGKLANFASVLPMDVGSEEIKSLQEKIRTQHPNSTQPQHHHSMRHHHICPPPYHMKITESTKCVKLKNKRKKKRKCHENERENDECHTVGVKLATSNADGHRKTKPEEKETDGVAENSNHPKKVRKKKSSKRKNKQSKSPDRNKDAAERNSDRDADDTMTTITPEDGADDD